MAGFSGRLEGDYKKAALVGLSCVVQSGPQHSAPAAPQPARRGASYHGLLPWTMHTSACMHVLHTAAYTHDLRTCKCLGTHELLVQVTCNFLVHGIALHTMVHGIALHKVVHGILALVLVLEARAWLALTRISGQCRAMPWTMGLP